MSGSNGINGGGDGGGGVTVGGMLGVACSIFAQLAVTDAEVDIYEFC